MNMILVLKNIVKHLFNFKNLGLIWIAEQTITDYLDYEGLKITEILD